MAFSQSFEIGNSTFMNLESQVKYAIDGKVKKVDGANTKDLEIIQESPTKKPNYLSRTRSRLLLTNYTNASNNNGEDVSLHRQRTFCRSKSDSILQQQQVNEKKTTAPLPHMEVAENYSNFFRSDFTLPETEQQQQQNKEHCEASMMRVSQIEAALNKVSDDDWQNTSDAKSEDFDVPIFSDDVKNLLESEQLGTLEWQDSLPLSDLPATEVIMKENNKQSIVEAAEEVIQMLDESRFVCPAADGDAAEQITAEIQRSRCELVKILADESTTERKKVNLSAEKYMNQSIASKAPKQAAQLSTDLESLKRISAWNLPHSVLQAYEQKGVVKMFDWQIECLRNPKVLFENCNLVYSAPTSAGKTLVSEILLLKTVLERCKKVIFILPFISVVREKMFYLQDLLTPAGYRVEGFFGGYTPPGGFDSINVACCTIEKANSIVNKLLEQGKLDEIGTVVVDEVHLISDPGRGYILELLLAKIMYMSRKYALQIQVITMSATLANVELLKCWLDAELFITDFRPVALQEMIKVGNKLYDSNLRFLRDVTKPFDGTDQGIPTLQNDGDHIAHLCIETLLESCSVIVFCPSKDWCENLSVQLAGAIHAVGKSGTACGNRLRAQLKREAIDEMKKQLRDIPTGLDSVLEKTITFGCAFHHAGLTTEERDIVEASFKSGALKIIVATSTLSSGVNLPARRVLIRSPLFGGKQMNSLTYRQMIGRAGRTGKDTLGESILICTENNARIGRELITADLKPISSCLEMDSSSHLKRALLEVISSGVATNKAELENFFNCTLLSAQKQLCTQEKEKSSNENTNLEEAFNFLKEYEFVRLQVNEETQEEQYIATRLGMACLASSMPPTDGLLLFAELQKSRRCFVLESELHAVYLVTPYSVCYQMQNLDWLLFLDLWEKLTPAMKKVGELVGVKESFLVRAMRGQTKLDYKLTQIHKRFYTALALQELVNETQINVVASKYKCNRGMLQSLQQMASTFAGIVSAFCNSLQWSTLSLIVSQFKERLYFGIHRDLMDLMRLPDLSQKRARTLFDGGITKLVELANADVFSVEKLLYNALSFDSAKQHDNENAYETEQRNAVRNFFITGKAGLTVSEAAKLLVNEARQFVQYEIGVGDIVWTQQNKREQQQQQDNSTELQQKAMHMSCEEERPKDESNKRKSNESETNVTAAKVSKAQIFQKEAKNIIDLDREVVPSTSKEARRQQQIKMMENMKLQNAAKCGQGDKIIDRNEDNLQPKSAKEQQDFVRRDNNDNLNDRKNVARKEIENKSDNNKMHATKPSNSSKPNQQQHKESIGQKQVVDKKENNNKAVENATARTVEEPNARYNLRRSIEKQQQQETMKRTHSPVAAAANKIDNKYTPKSSEKMLAINSGNIQMKPRRSPRNHLISSTRLRDNKENLNTTKSNLNKSQNVQALFMDSDGSFEMMNTGLTKALDAADKLMVLKSPKSEVELNVSSSDEVPSSQQLSEEQEVTATPTATTTAISHTSRFMRSNMRSMQQRRRLISTQKQHPIKRSLDYNKNDGDTLSPKQAQQQAPPPPPTTSSTDFSNFSLDNSNSLMKNPIQLNSSHIMSCSKVEADASSFKCIDIVDICGAERLFVSAMQELKSAKRFGFCLGLQKQECRRKPLIGSNLLINQVNKGDDENSLKAIQFPLDDEIYLAGIAFSIAENVVYYMNMQQTEEVKSRMKCAYLCQLLQSIDNTLLAFDAKEQLKLLHKTLPNIGEIRVQLEDPKVANWLLQPDKVLSYHLMAQQFAPECVALVNLCGSGRGYNSFGLDASSAILAKVRSSIEACVNLHILQGQIENLERIGTGQLLKFFKELEMPLQLSLCNMEIVGFPTSEATLRKLFQHMLETMKKLEIKIYEMHGSRFNLGSTAAVAKVLGLHRKANGRVSTSRQILEKIDSPISQLIVSYRKLSVTLTKNIQPLLKCIKYDRIHGQSITYTATGRISMTEPNLQNVAKDFDIQLEGNTNILISCRSAFYPSDKKRCLISADFCQLEMRILAHLSQDAALLQVMNSKTDIFIAIAARWNKIGEERVSEQLRNGTKQICYGIVYGMGMRSLADALKCSEQEATMVSQQFHITYPGIRAYAERVIKFARQNGYIETITGRRRYLENMQSGEPLMKSQAERQAINSTIQGSAADIAKSAILRMEKNVVKYHQKLGIDTNVVNLVLHLHDELIFEVPEEKAKKIAKVLSITMENCVKLSVPLKVKLKIGRSWAELKEVRL